MLLADPPADGGRDTIKMQGNSAMSRTLRLAALLGTLAIGACAVGPPPGPSVAALPAKDKSIEAFQQDDAVCRQYAAQTLGNVSPTEAANQTVANNAVAGTLLGAAAGAAIGAAVGNPAAGAAIGAGSGLVLGTATGANAANYSAGSMQRGYDISYAQCMTSRGNQVPAMASAGPAAGPYAGGPYPYPPPAYAYAPYPAYYPYPYAYYPGPFVGVGFRFGHCWRRWC
jgi:OmpA family protein